MTEAVARQWTLVLIAIQIVLVPLICYGDMGTGSAGNPGSMGSLDMLMGLIGLYCLALISGVKLAFWGRVWQLAVLQVCVPIYIFVAFCVDIWMPAVRDDDYVIVVALLLLTAAGLYFHEIRAWLSGHSRIQAKK